MNSAQTRTALRVPTLTTVTAAVAIAAALMLGATQPADATVAAAISPAVVAGADISWPQCPKGMGIPSRPTEGQPLPNPKTTKFVMIGLTNGPAFYPNPCLKSQVDWARKNQLNVAAYSMTTYPTSAQLKQYGQSGPYKGSDVLTKLRNTGYAQGQFNLANARKTALSTPIIWMDVEHYPVRPWSTNTTYNRAVFEGVKAAYQKAGYKVGIYSTSYQWKAILGTVRYGVPEWHTSGPTSQATARAACKSPSIQGGPTVISQWWTSKSDYDVLCPGFTSTAAINTYFRKQATTAAPTSAAKSAVVAPKLIPLPRHQRVWHGLRG